MINKNYGVCKYDIKAEIKEAKREARREARRKKLEKREAKRELRKSLWEEDYRVIGLFFYSLLLSVFTTIGFFIIIILSYKGVI